LDEQFLAAGLEAYVLYAMTTNHLLALRIRSGEQLWRTRY
jgi:hypothetical protein